MIYSVYALKSIDYDYVHVGLSSDVRSIVRQHNDGREQQTRLYAPFKLIYSEACSSRVAARALEKHLKTDVGQAFLKQFY